MSAPGYIYAVEHGDAVKIGFAKDPARRRSELNVGTSSELRLLGFIRGDKLAEARLHAEFSDYRIRGEWFRNEGPVALFVSCFPPLAPKPARAPTPLRRPVALPLEWETINLIAISMGVQKETLKKWRRRGVPAAWQIKMVHEHPALLSFDDFGTSVLIPLPGRPPPVHGPQRARDEGEREPNRQDFHEGHEGVRWL